MDRIAITGMGAVSAAGDCCYEMLKTIRNDLHGIESYNYFSPDLKDLPVGKAWVYEQDLVMFPRLEGKLVSRTMLLALCALREAINNGKVYEQKAFKKEPLKVAFVNATTVGGMDLTEQEFAQLRDWGGNVDCMRCHDCGATTKAIADCFGVFSEYTTVSTACSSAANALLVGAELLKSRQADIVIAGGAEALTKFHICGFNSLMILDHEPCRPFDKNRAGLNLGEGAAYVVMEREETVKEVNAFIGEFDRVSTYAYLTGYGNACDAFHQTATSDNGEGPFLAMTEALRTAGLKPQQIDYVNAHGTGTLNNDLSESAALRRVFGDDMPAVSSTKGYTGHATSAAGAIEVVITLQALKYDFFPINRGGTEQGEGLISPVTGSPSHHPVEQAMCNSFGFGGNDTSLIFSKHPLETVEDPDEELQHEVKELARVEICGTEELPSVSEFVKPMEARRMSRLMKAAVLSSMRALREAGVESPDAIITATAYGAVELSERLLNQLADNEPLKPTWFMQSTHNTIAGELAIRTRCHGYNITYTQGVQSLDWALRDAKRLIRQGRCNTVLVEYHDETTPLFRQLMERSGRDCQSEEVKSIAIILSCGE